MCSRNRRGSLTAEHLFDGVDGHVARMREKFGALLAAEMAAHLPPADG